MEWNERLKNIIDYVENHLQQKEEPIDSKDISKIAGCSYDFFQKVFSYMNGISFSEYVRLRKLTLAGYDLKSTDKKVIDISYEYGYDSPTSFTKAFRQFHGVSPKEARSVQAELKVYPKMQISSNQEYSWSLEQKRGFRLIGPCKRISCKEGEKAAVIPEFWNECQKNGTYSKLIAMDQGKPNGLYGLFDSYGEELTEMRYSIMVVSDHELPEDFIEIKIPDNTWAIFNCKGPVPQAIQNGWNYLKEEWLTKYPFKHAESPELEWYSAGNSFGENYLSQIWIPVIEEGPHT